MPEPIDLILWRHAEAADEQPGFGDLERALTALGRRQAAQMAAWLNQRIDAATLILVSPARRCQQTAQALGKPFSTVPALAPGRDASSLREASGWPEARHAVLVVGHQPTLGLAAAELLGGAIDPWSFEKAAVWWIRGVPGGDGGPPALHAMQAPDCR